MLGVLTGRAHTVMTTHAITHDADVIEIRRDPGVGGMTIVAGILTLEMIWRLAGGDHAVVTAGAGTDDLEVIHAHQRHPERRPVAGVTGIRAADMLGMLTGGTHTIMTTHAIAGDTNVVEIRRDPGVGGMTVIASVLAPDVVRRLASGDHAVVAAGAGTDDLEVVHAHQRHPERRAMAGVTGIRAAYVLGALSGGTDAVVAAHAIASNTNVVEIRRNPGVGGMTIVTGLLALNVVRRLTGRNDAVVAGLAATQNLKVIDPDHRHPHCGAVTAFAHTGRANVRGILAGSGDAVMAAKAVAADAGMVKNRGQPGIRVMAGLARLAGNDVTDGHSAGSNPIVAILAAAHDLGVVHPCDR